MSARNGGAPRRIDHVVFDVGQVLLHWDPELAFLDRIADPGARRWFLENVCTRAWNVEQDRGRPWQEAEERLIDDFPEHAENIRAYRANWHLMIPHAIEGSVQMMEKLVDEGIDVTLLTNFAADTFAETRQRFGFLDKPRGATVSGRIGRLKPEIEIYDLHTENFGIEPSATLFIDDSPANVEGAIAAGWQSVRFTSPGQLETDLRERGLPV